MKVLEEALLWKLLLNSSLLSKKEDLLLLEILHKLLMEQLLLCLLEDLLLKNMVSLLLLNICLLPLEEFPPKLWELVQLLLSLKLWLKQELPRNKLIFGKLMKLLDLKLLIVLKN
jgi:hypothetical protein